MLIGCTQLLVKKFVEMGSKRTIKGCGRTVACVVEE
ncbi:unnamed protein product [Schistosoma curassoni]|uniref:DUF3700 domain-containing protein n=1 Tax=Schistosoma curassoni TaxID=6186 RepID=A0A183KS88_9TREM|nr:unnamed protein product [Schistosoma curassoni]